MGFCPRNLAVLAAAEAIPLLLMGPALLPSSVSTFPGEGGITSSASLPSGHTALLHSWRPAEGAGWPLVV